MAQADDGQGAYTLVTADNETKSSQDYSGKGTANYPNNDIYKGDFFNGVRHGTGEYTHNFRADEGTNDGVHNGAWDKNFRHGIGKQTYPGVGTYYGYWKGGHRHGEGVMSYENKDLYSGNWSEGQKDGQGTYTFAATNEKYVGNYMKGQMTSGKWQSCNGDFFQGNFDNNKP